MSNYISIFILPIILPNYLYRQNLYLRRTTSDSNNSLAYCTKKLGAAPLINLILQLDWS